MPGLLRGIARTAVVAGTASGVAGRVRHRQEGRWAREEQAQEPQQQQYAPPPQQQYAPPPQQYAPPPPAAAPPSAIEQLKELAELKQQGVLTDDEFAAQKAKVLAA
jgi:hypothetical protein